MPINLLWSLYTVACILVFAFLIAYDSHPEGELQGFAGIFVNILRWIAGLQRKTIHAAEYAIPYLDNGSGERVVVLIHGFGANKDCFLQLAMMLRYKMARVRLIIPDIPGFGATERKLNDDFSIEKQADRLGLFVSKIAALLKVDAVHVAGNSMGGYIAGLIAVKHPKLVTSIWLINPAGTAAALKKSEALNLFESTGENVLTFQSREELDRLLSYVYYADPPTVPSFFLDAMVEKASQDKKLHQSIYDTIRKGKSDLAERLLTAGCDKIPVLLVWGDMDRVLNVDGVSELLSVLPKAKVVVMKDMGHCPMLERPLETAHIYLEFLNSLES